MVHKHVFWSRFCMCINNTKEKQSPIVCYQVPQTQKYTYFQFGSSVGLKFFHIRIPTKIQAISITMQLPIWLELLKLVNLIILLAVKPNWCMYTVYIKTFLLKLIQEPEKYIISHFRRQKIGSQDQKAESELMGNLLVIVIERSTMRHSNDFRIRC